MDKMQSDVQSDVSHSLIECSAYRRETVECQQVSKISDRIRRESRTRLHLAERRNDVSDGGEANQSRGWRQETQWKRFFPLRDFLGLGAFCGW